METTIKQIFTCKMCQKQRWESDISRKMQISHTFCWSKSISGAFDSNPVDTRRRFKVDISVTLDFFQTTHMRQHILLL